MKINQLYSHPDESLLENIVGDHSLYIASPYYSDWASEKIDGNIVSDLVFLTRLPCEYNRPPAYIENHPSAIISLYQRIDNITVHTLSTLHAKIYMNSKSAWIGSSNFSRNGFSGYEEVLAETLQPANEIVDAFDSYLAASTVVGLSELQKLASWIDAGLTTVLNSRTPEAPVRQNAYPPFSIEDFEVWLEESSAPHSEVRSIILAQLNGRNQMSGHVRHAFNGVLSFFRFHPGSLPLVRPCDYSDIPDTVLGELREFIIAHGDEYRGDGGGYWRNYLSTNIGGTQTRGGAGDAVVKRCLILIPHYIESNISGDLN